MDCDIADIKRYKYDEISNKMTVGTPSETLEQMLDGTSGTDGTNATNGTNEMTENEFD